MEGMGVRMEVTMKRHPRADVPTRAGTGPATVAVLAISAIAAATLAGWILHEPALEVDRASYEGKGGEAFLAPWRLPVPDLAPAASSTAVPSAILGCQGRDPAALRQLLGRSERPVVLGDGRMLLLWPSAVALSRPETGQWPTAHVCAVVEPGGRRIGQVALVGSLGRVLETRPGEPGYESMASQP